MNPESRYELLENIGSGSFATVYRARDAELGREVAVKQIHQEYLAVPENLDRYWQEAQLLASLQHPNIVTVYDVYREQGWLIMELMQTNLADRMRGRPMDVRALKTTVAHTLRALKYLHSRGIVHGDIKPANLMIDARKRVKLGDFGLARRVSDEEGSLLKGTTKYMAPEVVSDEFGDVGPSSDLYSLGFAAYELLCGPNFEDLFPGLSAFGRNKQVAWMMWHAAPDRRLPEISRVLEGVPDDLAHVIEKLCEKDQARRYESADEALADLNVDQKVIRVGAAPDEENDSDPADGARKKRLLIIGAAFAASLILSLVILLMPSGNSNGDGPPQRYAIVRKVDLDSNQLELEDPEDGIPFDFELGERPRIFLLNEQQNIQLRELRPGDRLKIERETVDGHTRFGITATRPIISRGRVESIDLDESTLTVVPTDGPLNDRFSVRVPPRTRITVNDESENHLSGRIFELADLREGDEIELTHLNELGRRAGRVADRIVVLRSNQATGLVEGFDPVASLLRLKPHGRSGRDAWSMTIADDASVTLRDGDETEARSVRPHDLRENDRVSLAYDTLIREIAAIRPTRVLHAAVQNVSREDANTSAVVKSGEGEEFLLQVEPSTEVTLESVPAELGDLRPYDEGWIAYGASRETAASSPVLAFDAIRPLNHHRWAILLGVGSYSDPAVSSLPHSLPNLDRIRAAFIRRYAVPKERIRISSNGTAAEMRNRIEETLVEVRPQTQLVVYAACRAFIRADGKVYLAATDFTSAASSDGESGGKGVSLDWLIAELDRCPSRDKLLLLDIGEPQGESAKPYQPNATELVAALSRPPESTTILISGRKVGSAAERPEAHLTAFAFTLSEAFRGAADADRDLHLTVDELYEFVRTQMSGASNDSSRSPVLVRPAGQVPKNRMPRNHG